MIAPLTPFPDGHGYMEYAWGGLTRAQRDALLNAYDAKLGSGRHHSTATLSVLQRRELLDGRRLTDRGRALAEWAVAR